MSLRKQPYLPLYVRDFLCDERLCACSAATTGVYIRLMCQMHLAPIYGRIDLDEPPENTANIPHYISLKLAQVMPYDWRVIEKALKELEKVKLVISDGIGIYQPRMVKDNDLSEKRASGGSKGMKSRYKKIDVENNTNTDELVITKVVTNSESEIENANENEIEILKNVSPQCLALAREYGGGKAVQKLLMAWLSFRASRGLTTLPTFVEINLKNLKPLADASGLDLTGYLEQVLARGWAAFYEIEPKKKKPEREKPNFSIEEYDSFTLGNYIIGGKNDGN